ncbi:MAG: PilZ domain-containing protein [Candidatus Omnitrophica bacterium]|nr:PilZ domain-containing protein [Candidatus Omnitrophota bacterium]
MDTETALIGLFMLLLVLIILAIISRYETAQIVSVKRKKKKPNKEARMHPRYKTSLRVKYNTPIEEGISWIKDVSLQGAQLFLNKGLDIGTSLDIEVKLPNDSSPILVTGDIVWIKENNAGFHFRGEKETEINRLVEYCKSREDAY